jgi:hypothetical protein
MFVGVLGAEGDPQGFFCTSAPLRGLSRAFQQLLSVSLSSELDRFNEKDEKGYSAHLI